MQIPKMSSYRKRVGAFGDADGKRDESVLPFNVSPESYNVDMTSGALRGGYGVQTHSSVPSAARRYWIHKHYSEAAGEQVEEFVYQDKYGLLSFYEKATDTVLYISGKVYPPMDALNYRIGDEDVLILSCEGHRLLIWNGKKLVEHPDSPMVSSMAIHYERLFVTSSDEPTRVYFSDNLDPTDWNISSDGAGFIELLDERGKLNKVVSFGSYLYIFRDHGISRVTAFGDQSEFSVVNLFVTAGRIYPSSIASCGSLVMFAASDGMYAFDGYECKRVLRNLDGLLVLDERSIGEYFDGKYYLACEIKFKDDRTVGCESAAHTVNGLLVYDPISGEFSISRGLDIAFMKSCSYNGEDFLMCCESNMSGVITRCGKRFSASLPKHWSSPLSDFGAPDRTKILREAYFLSDVPLSVTVRSEKREKTAAVQAGNRKARLNFSGKLLAMEIDTDAAECSIKPPTLVYSLY